jgi:hypothetical protein
VFWSLGELCCWVYELLVGSHMPDGSNGKGKMKGQPSSPGWKVEGSSRRLIPFPHKTMCKHA